MADYTIRLCDLVNSGYDVVGKALSNYPLDDESYRTTLNNAILRHYWYNEIGMETADMFSWALDKAMCEIMPYYNERRAIDMLDVGVDPLMSYSEMQESIFTKTGTRENTASSTVKNNSTSTRTDDFTNSKNNTSSSTADGNSKRTDNLNENTTNETNDSGTQTNTRTDDLSENANTSTTDTGNVIDTRTDNITSETSNNNSENNSTTTNSASTATDNGYRKDYGIPTSGGSAGDGPGGFSNDFATGGQVTNNENESSMNGSVTEKNSSNGTSTTTNTGTVKNESVRDLAGSTNSTRTNTGTVKDESSRDLTSTGTSTRTNTGTVDMETNNTVSSTLTESGENKGTSENVENGTINKDDTYNETVNDNGNNTVNRSGTNEAKFELLRKYREVIENITMMIVRDREVQNCFMGVLGNVCSIW